MRAEDFVEISSLIWVMETRVLSSEGIDRALETSTPEECLNALTQATEYDFSSLRAPGEYETVLKKALEDFYSYMYELAGEKNSAVVDILSCRYDFHNIKVALKAAFNPSQSVPSESMYVRAGKLSPEGIEEYIAQEVKSRQDDQDSEEEAPKYSFIPKEEEAQKDTKGLSDYAVKAIDALIGSFFENGDPQKIDLEADKAMLELQLSIAAKAKFDFASRYLKRSIDFYNVKALMRAKNMKKTGRFASESLAPGGSVSVEELESEFDKAPEELTSALFYQYFGSLMQKGMESYPRKGNFSDLERQFDNDLIKAAKEARYASFGPELLFSFILNKENEIRQIRLILAGKINGIKPDGIRERLRDNYA